MALCVQRRTAVLRERHPQKLSDGASDDGRQRRRARQSFQRVPHVSQAAGGAERRRATAAFAPPISAALPSAGPTARSGPQLASRPRGVAQPAVWRCGKQLRRQAAERRGEVLCFPLLVQCTSRGGHTAPALAAAGTGCRGAAAAPATCRRMAMASSPRRKARRALLQAAPVLRSRATSAAYSTSSASFSAAAQRSTPTSWPSAAC